MLPQTILHFCRRMHWTGTRKKRTVFCCSFSYRVPFLSIHATVFGCAAVWLGLSGLSPGIIPPLSPCEGETRKDLLPVNFCHFVCTSLASRNLFEDRVGHGRGCLVFAKQENPTFVFLFLHFTSLHFYLFLFPKHERNPGG
jgi:hypothetical protein